ncbi:MAG: helix-turn-helix domain-containing protein, partial [Candidatus Obscuribacterales bacterium]|nr:helix-turn-helix domain-containing protein [Candidatus Obscuribacterales bacterium]
VDGPHELSEADSSDQDQTRDGSSPVQDGSIELSNPITVEEAAAALGISTNAVCKRLRKGTLIGKKVPGKFKDEWVVEGSEIIEILSVDFPDEVDCPEEGEEEERTDQDQTDENSGSVQNGPGAVQESSDALSRLIELVDKQSVKLESAAGQIGYLQAQLESQTRLLKLKEEELKLLTQARRIKGGGKDFALGSLAQRLSGTQ